IGVGGALLFSDYTIPEMTLSNWHPDNLPIFPILFFTITCGALSGFHATQSPIISRTTKKESEGRYVFYGMIGDCVAWNPDKAPQVIVKNKIGNIGKLSGCQFDNVISDIVYSENNNAPPTPIVQINKISPNYTYNFPMILSIGNIVERIK